MIYPLRAAVDFYRETGRRCGVDLPVAEIRRRFQAALHRLRAPLEGLDASTERQPWRGIVAAVFDARKDLAASLFDELWRHFSQPESWRVFEDVEPAFRALDERQILFGIASNFDQRLVEICRASPILARCRFLHHSAELGFAKPHPQFYRAVEQRLSLQPAQILMVGDDLTNDYTAPLAAGWQAVRVQRKRQMTLHHVIASLGE